VVFYFRNTSQKKAAFTWTRPETSVGQGSSLQTRDGSCTGRAIPPAESDPFGIDLLRLRDKL